MSVEEFWDHDMEEVDAVVRANHRRLEDADKHAAHYTAWQMQMHSSKRIKPEKIRRIKPKKAGTKDQDELEQKRSEKATSEEWAASLAKMPKRVLRRAGFCGS